MTSHFYFKIIFCLILLFDLRSNVNAQKHVSTSNLAWYDVSIQYPLTSEWSFYGEYGQRRMNFVKDLNQQLFRGGFSRKFDSDLKLTLGLANFHNDINPAYSFKNRPEYRSFQFFEIEKSIGFVKTELRLRIEQRWNQESTNSELHDSFTFNHRMGYRIKGLFPISLPFYRNKLLFGEIGNETMVNYGKEVELNTFDQSRFYTGILVKWSENYSMQLTFMYLYQQKNNGIDFSEQYIIRFSQKLVL